MPKSAKSQSRLTNVELTLSEDAVLKNNSNGTPFLVARGTAKSGRQITVMTYVAAGIKALTGAVAKQTVRVYGTWAKDHKTLSVMGLTPARAAK